MLDGFEKHFTRINGWAVGGMLGIMFVLVFTNVVTRYCFGFSLATAEEISTFLMIWVTYLGAGLALRQGRLASIDVFQDRLPPRLRLTLRWSFGAVMVLFFLALAYYGARFVALGWSQETFATQIPRGIPYLVLPAGALLFAVHLVLIFSRWLRREWEGTPAEDETEGSERMAP